MTGRELLLEVLRDTWGVPLNNLASGTYADDIARTPSGAELIRRADAEPVLRAALENLTETLASIEFTANVLGLTCTQDDARRIASAINTACVALTPTD